MLLRTAAAIAAARGSGNATTATAAGALALVAARSALWPDLFPSTAPLAPCRGFAAATGGADNDGDDSFTARVERAAADSAAAAAAAEAAALRAAGEGVPPEGAGTIDAPPPRMAAAGGLGADVMAGIVDFVGGAARGDPKRAGAGLEEIARELYRGRVA